LDRRKNDISVDDARRHLLDAVTPTSAEHVSLLDALGLTLAADVISPVALPPFDASSVDGYAVQAIDTAAASRSNPVSLTIIGQALPGSPCAIKVEPGNAIQIMTGAPVPNGATSIVPFENTDELDHDRTRDIIRILASSKTGDGIRPTGSGIQSGTLALRRGAVLSPARLGTLSSLGLSTVEVHRRPRIALLSVGDQFVAPGTALDSAKMYEANEVAMAGAVREAGGIPIPLGIAADQINAIGDHLRIAPAAEVIVLSGGVAHGAYDVVVRGHATNADGRRCFLPAYVAVTDGAYVATLVSHHGTVNLRVTSEPNALVVVPESQAEVVDGDRLRAQMLTWDD